MVVIWPTKFYRVNKINKIELRREKKILYRIINVFEFLHFQTNFSTNINSAAIVLNFVVFLEVFVVVFQLRINAL